MAQYKVPQKLDLEDKVVGPLTLVQFFQVAVGGMILYLFYQIFDTELFLGAGIPVALATLAIAFLKVHDQPLTHFISAGWQYIRSPKERVWGKKSELEEEQVEIVAGKKQVAPLPTKKVTQSELEKLSAILDTYGKPAEPVKPEGGEKRGP
jgi:hypothetical protein